MSTRIFRKSAHLGETMSGTKIAAEVRELDDGSFGIYTLEDGAPSGSFDARSSGNDAIAFASAWIKGREAEHEIAEARALLRCGETTSLLAGIRQLRELRATSDECWNEAQEEIERLRAELEDARPVFDT